MERDNTTKIIGGILAVLMFFALGFGLYYLVTHWDTIFGSTTEQPTEPEEPVEKVEISDWVFNGKLQTFRYLIHLKKKWLTQLSVQPLKMFLPMYFHILKK